MVKEQNDPPVDSGEGGGGGSPVGQELLSGYLWVGDSDDEAVAKKIRIPKYSDLFVAFEPLFTALARGGDFDGQSIVEKGHEVPGATLAWASQAGGDFPIDDSDDYEMNDLAIVLDALDPLTGGNYLTAFTEILHGTGFDVLLKSGSEETVKNALLSWWWRMFWFADVRDVLLPSEAQFIVNQTTPVDHSALRQARTGTFNFDASGGKYLWFAWPQGFGQASQFVFAGLPTTFVKYDFPAVQNKYVAVTDYYFYRSLNIQTGASLNIVVS